MSDIECLDLNTDTDNDNDNDNNNDNDNDNDNQYDLLDNIIQNNNFNQMISTLSDKLKLNNSDNNTDNSNSDYSYSDTETNNDIILDNYLLNSAGENIADILTKINNNLTRIINHTIKN